MCQLLGMNCNVPTDICFSFTGFQARGGLTDVHQDGWGIAFFEGSGCRVFLDDRASVDSPLAQLVRQYPIRSCNVIAHIRKATQGRIGLENTHPFQRELWRRYWIFAHNGDLEGFAPTLDGTFQPVGTTDSEQAFCLMLQRLRAAHPLRMPPRDTLFAALADLTREIASFGEFNYLLSNGECLYAHCSTRLSYLIRQAPFSSAHLKDQDVSVDFNDMTTPDDRVAIVATVPLTDNEQWTTLAPGTLVMFADGSALRQATTG